MSSSWFGIEPTGASRVTGTGLFELAGNFPWNLVFWFIGRTGSRRETEKRCGERTE